MNNDSVKSFIVDESVKEGYLEDWYITSIWGDASPPIWTEGHISEMCKDFYIIPKETVDKIL